jgi:hypothetical protein
MYVLQCSALLCSALHCAVELMASSYTTREKERNGLLSAIWCLCWPSFRVSRDISNLTPIALVIVRRGEKEREREKEKGIIKQEKW